MSEDMSMFKKMKDKINDEVSSATNKLQSSIQIIDQLANSIGQQVVRNDSMPHQRLPELSEQTALPTDSRFSLIDDNPIGECEADEELNSEISPQHQLFNERSIRRLRSPSNDKRGASKNKNGSVTTNSSLLIDTQDNQNSVIDINHLSSDLEDDFGEPPANEDGEIDLLAEKRLPSTSRGVKLDGDLAPNRLVTYKARYRDVVHALRRLNDDHRLDRFQLESETKRLTDQISALKEELNNVKQQLHLASNSAINSDSERKSNSSSPHQSNSKQANKIKDLEKLMTKCKESLKAKNAQLKILKNSLIEVDKFREHMDELKSELKELKNAHETWTLSIAENKRVMHQEIEEKNSEMDNMKAQLKDSNNRLLQQKSNIQNLESRLVSMSAAHQKERESLIKDLTNAKNSAIKRLQREHELQLERVKLDLEKSIEGLKSEILIRDEQIIRGGQRQQELEKQNCSLTTDLENYKKRCEDQLGNFNELKTEKDGHVKEIGELKSQLEELKNQSSDCNDLQAKNAALEQQTQELNQRVQDLNEEVARLEGTNQKMSQELDAIKSEAEQKETKPCSSCREFQDQLSKEAEEHEQTLFELTTKLDLMTTANADQEKALSDLKTERDAAFESIRVSKLESEELSKKNESLLQVLQENDSEMQAQQEQLNQIASLNQHLESLKKDNASLNSSLEQIKCELSERNGDLVQSQETIDELRKRLAEVEQAFKSVSADLENLKREKESLVGNVELESKKRREVDQKLVVNILAALKNLETPDTSPGSDKTYHPEEQESITADHEHNLPDPIKLAENLSSLALDRSNAYMTSNQRLQAVLLDNTMISEEVKRLREELNALSREKAQEIMGSLEEVERLRTENQALIHDQKAYDDQIAIFEADIESLKQKIHELESHKSQTIEASTETTTDETATVMEELAKKEHEIEQLRKLIAENEASKRSLQMVESNNIPSSTEFEYLKNIVYQFLMGREPITLARVISAIFKFDKDQMEQICRIQEAIHQVSG